MIRTLLSAALAAVLLGGSAVAAPVKTDRGLVEGVAADGLTAYKGIPFAAPPVGALRWKPPQPAPTWTGVRKAEGFAPACTQSANISPLAQGQPKIPSDEDCLYLNVWTAAAPKAK